MTDTKQEPKSAFLIAQEKLMQARAEQDRSIEERQRYTLTSGANEKYDPSAKYELVRQDITNNTVERRVITPLPTPQRIQPAKPLAKGDIVEMLNELRDEMATEQEKFDRKDEIDKERTDKRGQLIAKVNELTAQLNAAKAELDQLNREGSVRDGWIEFAKRAELRITQIATATYGHLLEKFSQDRHEAPFSELTELLKEEIRFKADRSGVRTFTHPSFARLHAAPRESITNARIEATLKKVFTAAEKLEHILEK
jgi:hypothetical protein